MAIYSFAQKLVLFLVFSSLLYGETIISLSLRDCILDNYPFDYEIRVENLNQNHQKWGVNRAIFLFEREIGIKGLGYELNANLPPFCAIFNKSTVFELNWYCRQVKNIAYENFNLSYPCKANDFDILIGLTYSLSYFRNPGILINFKTKYRDNLNLQINTDLDKRNILSLEIKKRYRFNNQFIEPNLTIKQMNDNNFWWFKIYYGFSLDIFYKNGKEKK